MKVKLDKFSLISARIVALKLSIKSAWINSLARANLYPEHRLCFEDLIKKIEKQIETGESFFQVPQQFL